MLGTSRSATSIIGEKKKPESGGPSNASSVVSLKSQLSKVKLISVQGQRSIKEKRLDESTSETTDVSQVNKESQAIQRWQKPQGFVRFGFERLGHMYTTGFPFRFEELQGRHPFDFVEETKTHFKYHPKFYGKSVPIEDKTLLETREWLEPVQNGQLYWDYCREKWLDKESRMGAACAPVGCLFSLWEISSTFKNNGGAAFMFAYFIVMLFFGIPFIYMELAVGQFHRISLVKTISEACPLFQGLAIIMLLSCTVEYILSMCRLPILLFYFLSSFRDVLPWKTCQGNWATGHCKPLLDTKKDSIKRGERTPAVDFFRYIVKRETSYPSNSWGYWITLFPDFEVVLCFLVLVLVFRQLLQLRLRQLGRIMFFTFFLALILCIWQWLITGNEKWVGFKRENPPLKKWIVMGFWGFGFVARNYSSTNDAFVSIHSDYFGINSLDFIYNENTWLAAVRHTVLGTGIGTGVLITVGGHNSFTNDDIKTLAFFTGLSSYILHLVVVALFTICYYTLTTTPGFQNSSVIPYGTDIVFELLPQMAAQHPRSAHAWFMFNSLILGLLLAGCLRVICVLHTIKQHYCDDDKEYFEPFLCNYEAWEKKRGDRQKRYTYAKLAARRKAKVMTKFMLFAGSLSLLALCSFGLKYFFIAEIFWYKYTSVMIVFLEGIAIFFFLGVGTLNDYIRKMTTWQVTLFYRFVWKCVIPVVTLMYFIFLSPSRLSVNVTEIRFYEDAFFYCFCLVPICYIVFQSLVIVLTSKAISFWNRIVLESTPVHDHSKLMKGVKSPIRLHWMHHLIIPKGIGRRSSSQSSDGEDPWFYNTFMEFIWYELHLKWLNSFNWKCVDYYEYGLDEVHFSMFPQTPFPVRSEKEKQPPEYIPNKQFKRLRKMKKKSNRQMRKCWVNDKILVAREGVILENNQDEPEKEEKVEVSSSSSKENSKEDSPDDSSEAYDHVFEGELQVSDGESYDDDESKDWNSLSGDESDEDLMTLLKMDWNSEEEGEPRPERISSIKSDETYDSLEIEDNREIEQEEKAKVDDEFLFEDIDDEQEVWTDTDVLKENEEESESDFLTDEDMLSEGSEKNHSDKSMGDSEIRVDVMFSESDEGTKKKTGFAPNLTETHTDEVEGEQDSWSDCSLSCSDESSYSSESSASVASYVPPAKDRRVSFSAKIAEKEFKKTRKEKDDKIKIKKDKPKEPADDDDDGEVFGPYTNKPNNIRKTLKDMKRTFNNVKDKIQNFLLIGNKSKKGRVSNLSMIRSPR